MKKLICILAAFLIMFSASPVLASYEREPHAQSLEPIQCQTGLAVLLGTWDEGCGIEPEAFEFFYRRADEKKYTVVQANPNTSRERYNLQIEVQPDTDYVYYFSVKTSSRYFFGETVKFRTLCPALWGAEASVFEEASQNREYIFGDSAKYRYLVTDPPAGYADAAEASMHITTVEVPVWRIGRGGKKYASSYSFEINVKLAKNISAVFREIYELPQKYPVKKLKTFKYRQIGGSCSGSSRSIEANGVLSMHSFGTAIDVNPAVNGLYYMHDGRNPQSPYYLPDEVIDIFKKYGWVWGGDWDEYVDTMHFQYTG